LGRTFVQQETVDRDPFCELYLHRPLPLLMHHPREFLRLCQIPVVDRGDGRVSALGAREVG
jgi:hypothetical protein